MTLNLLGRSLTSILLLTLFFSAANSETIEERNLRLQYEDHSLLLVPALNDNVLEEFYQYGFDIIRVNDDGSFKIVATEAEAKLLSERFGAIIEIDNMEERSREGLSKILPFGGYRTWSGIQATLDSFVVNYPDKAMLDTIGYTLEGRPLLALKISDNVQNDEDEPEINLNGMHHAREPMGYEILINYVRWVLTHPGNEFADSLLNGYETWVTPVINPDGLVYNELTNPEGGGMWRKNRQINPDLTYGVDLNRNYSFRYAFNNNGSSTITTSQVYRGTGAFSELESQAVRDFYNDHDFCLSLHFHAYGNFMNMPFNFFNQPISIDQTQFLETSQYLAALAQCNLNYNYIGTGPNGTSYDWTYGEQFSKKKCYSLLVEAGQEFWPPTNEIEPINAQFLPLVQFAVLSAYDVWKTPARSVSTDFTEVFDSTNACSDEKSDTVWFYNSDDVRDLTFDFEFIELSAHPGWCTPNLNSGVIAPGDSISIILDYHPTELDGLTNQLVVTDLLSLYVSDPISGDTDTLMWLIHNHVINRDSDYDGVLDGCDVCAVGDDNIDTDADGIPDACDNCPDFDNSVDTDTDGIPDGCDNCPAVANVDQTDGDGDGIGDLCDICCGKFTAGLTGNIDCSEEGKRNLADISRLIDRVYISKDELCCEWNGNVDGDLESKVNLADITALIDHVYISKLETALCD